MASDRNSKTCRAKDPATCRYHRYTVIEKKAVAYLDDVAEMRKDYFERAHMLHILKDSKERMRKLMAELAVEVNDKVNSGELNPTSSYSYKTSLTRLVREKMKASDAPHNLNDVYPWDTVVKSVMNQFITDEDLNKPSWSAASRDGRNFMDADVQGEPYEKAMAMMVAERGQVVEDIQNTYYGSWADTGSTAHVRKCGISKLGTPQEDSWSEFNGTFADSDRTEHGVSCDVECKCGVVKGKLRVDGSLTDVTRTLVNEYAAKVFEFYK